MTLGSNFFLPPPLVPPSTLLSTSIMALLFSYQYTSVLLFTSIPPFAGGGTCWNNWCNGCCDDRVKNSVVDEITYLKTKFARLMCKSIRRKNSTRFNTASFSLVHSREKLWSITVCCPRRKEGREEKRSFPCVFHSCRRALYIMV